MHREHEYKQQIRNKEQLAVLFYEKQMIYHTQMQPWSIRNKLPTRAHTKSLTKKHINEITKRIKLSKKTQMQFITAELSHKTSTSFNIFKNPSCLVPSIPTQHHPTITPLVFLPPILHPSDSISTKTEMQSLGINPIRIHDRELTCASHLNVMIRKNKLIKSLRVIWKRKICETPQH